MAGGNVFQKIVGKIDAFGTRIRLDDLRENALEHAAEAANSKNAFKRFEGHLQSSVGHMSNTGILATAGASIGSTFPVYFWSLNNQNREHPGQTWNNMQKATLDSMVAGSGVKLGAVGGYGIYRHLMKK